MQSVSREMMARAGLPDVPKSVLMHGYGICALADLVVIGRVEQLKSQWITTGSRRAPTTDLVVSVESKVHGEAGDQLRFAAPVGWDHGRFSRFGQYPEFERGARYLFVFRRREDGLQVAGGGYGAVPLDSESQLPPQSVMEHLWTAHCSLMSPQGSYPLPEID